VNDGWFALGGAALGFASAFGVEWYRQRADKKTTGALFQRATLLDLQETTDSFLKAMADVHRHTAPGAVALPDGFDVMAAQDHARELSRRIRILGSRATDRQVERMAGEVFGLAYGALAASASMDPTYKAWEKLNTYIGTLVR
jgi:hypothetical protein